MAKKKVKDTSPLAMGRQQKGSAANKKAQKTVSKTISKTGTKSVANIAKTATSSRGSQSSASSTSQRQTQKTYGASSQRKSILDSDRIMTSAERRAAEKDSARKREAQLQKTTGRPSETAKQQMEKRVQQAQRQKSGYNSQASKRTQDAANRAIKNTPALAKKAVKDVVSGHAKTIADVTELTANNKNGVKAKAMKMGIQEGTSAYAKLQQERKKTVEEAKKERLRLTAEEEARQKAWDKRSKGAKGLEKAYYGALESGIGMATDMAIGFGSQFGSLAAMGSRTYGSTRGQAEKEGATAKEDRLYSLAQAGKEVGTELMFPGAGLAKRAYGNMGLPLAEKAANVLTKGLRGKTADIARAGLRLAGGTGEEVAEEVGGWLLDPVIKEYTYGRSTRGREAMRRVSKTMRSEIKNENDARNAAAYLSSDDFLTETAKQYVADGMSREDAAQVALKMRDYLTASLSGDIDTMQAIEKEISKKVGGKKKLKWDYAELRDTIASTALLTAVTGAPGTITTASRGAAIRDELGDDGISALIKSAINFEDSTASQKAQAAKDRVDGGKELTSTQVYDLAIAQMEQDKKDFQRQNAAIGAAEDKMSKEKLIDPFVVTDTGMPIMGEATTKAYDEAYDEAKSIMSRLSETTDENKESIDTEEIDTGARAIAGFMTGVFTVNDANALNVSNTKARQAFSEATGIDLNQYVVRGRDGKVDAAKTNAATKDALFAMASDNLVNTAEAETLNWMDREKGNVVSEVSARMGGKGGLALQIALDDIDERDRSSYMMTANAADFMYQQGRNLGVDFDTIKNDAKAMFPKIKETKLQMMYEAGLADREIANNKAIGLQVKMGEKISLKGERHVPTGKVYIDTMNTPKGTEIRTFSEIANQLGADIHFVDYVYDSKGNVVDRANGSYDPKTNSFYLNVGTGIEQNVGYIFMHECTHYLKMNAPEQYQELENLVREKWFKLNPEQMQDEIAKKIEAYKKATKGKQVLTEEEALEEIIADAAHEFINDPNFAEQVAEENPSLAKALLDSIRNALRMLRRILSSGTIDDDTHMNSLFSELGILDEAERIWLNAYTQAVKMRADQAINDWQDAVNADARFSIPEYTQEEMDAHRQYLIDSSAESYEDPYTNDLNESGFIFPDGSLPRMGDYGARADDHNLVIGAYDDIGYDTSQHPKADAMARFLNEGNIRYMPENGSIELGTEIEPTYEQYERIREMDYVNMIEFTAPDGSTADYKEYDGDRSGVVNDIKRFYRDGEIGGSELAQFRYSISEEDREALNADGIEELEDGTTARYSVSSWESTNKDKKLKALVDAGHSERAAKKWIKDIDSIASIILGDPDRLDYEADPSRSFKKDNGDYYMYTLDASTLCDKRRIYQGTYNAIQHALPNTPLTDQDVIRLRGLLKEYGYKAPCGICYVESQRKILGTYAKEWYDNYDRKDEIKLEDVTTSDGLKALKKTKPEIAEAFEKAMAAKGVQSPKVVELRTDYREDLKKMRDSTVEKLNNRGGLRFHSFSDFETPHLIDTMQAVMDMSAKGLMGMAYTKVPNFVAAFGPTGIKINLSLIAKTDKNGNAVYDEDGRLVFDDVEGIPYEEASKWRDAYPDDVAFILVGKDKAHTLAALNDERIDFVIPFHRSKWSEGDMKKLGLVGYEDFATGHQENGLFASDFWKYNKTGKQNAEAYLKLCAKKGVTPVFEQLLVDNGDGSYSLQPDGSTDNYWKLLVEGKMYNHITGKGAKQKVVKPNFNMEEARRILDEYEGGADTLPIANDVVDAFVEEYKANHPGVKYSLPTPSMDDAYMSAVNSGNMEEAQRLVDEAAKSAGYDIRAWHRAPVWTSSQKFTVFDPSYTSIAIRTPGWNWFSTDEDYIDYFGKSTKEHGTYKGFIKADNPLDVGNIENIAATIHYDFSGGYEGVEFTDDFANLAASINMEPEELYGLVNIDYGAENKDYDEFDAIGETYEEEPLTTTQIPIYAITRSGAFREIVEKAGYDSIKAVEGPEARKGNTGVTTYGIPYSSQFKSADPVTYAEDGSVIPLSERFDPNDDDIRYSLPTQDSDGRVLSDGQMEYFKNSQARDEQGRLQVVYHTTNHGGFTVFDPSYSDDKRSLFFASNFDVSQTYGSRANKPIEFLSAEDKELADEFPFIAGEELLEKQRGYYQVYLNLENPLVVDAKKHTWRDIPYGPEGNSLREHLEELEQSSNMLIRSIRAVQDAYDDDGYPHEINVEIKYMRKKPEGGWYLPSTWKKTIELKDNPASDWYDASVDMWTEVEVALKGFGLPAMYINELETNHLDFDGDIVWTENERSEDVSCDYINTETEEYEIVDPYDFDNEGIYTTRELAELAEEQDYDGVIIRNCVDIGGTSSLKGDPVSDIFIAFSSNQVKDFDNQNPTENPDIRWSITPEDEAMEWLASQYELEDVPLEDEQAEEGRVRMAKSKKDFIESKNVLWNQKWLTEGKVLDESAKKHIKNVVMGAMANSDTTSQYKKNLVDNTFIKAKSAYWLMKDGKYKDAGDLLWDAAVNMIENVEFIEDTAFKQYKDLRDYLRTTPLKLGDEYWSDVEYNEFRKKNMGRMKFVRGITNIDEIYQELQDKWPEWFNEEEEMSPPDQLLQIDHVLDAIQPYKIAYSSEEAADLANDIVSDLYDIVYEGKEYKSVADTYKERYDRKTKALKLRHEEALAKVKEQGDLRVQREREKTAKQKERAERWKLKTLKERLKRKQDKENRKSAKERAKHFGNIQNNIDWLTTRLVNETKDKNIPEGFRRSLAHLLMQFDMQTERSKKLEEKYGPAKKTLKIRELQKRLEQISNEEETGEFRYNGYLFYLMDALADKVDGKTIDALDTEDLIVIDTMLKSICHNFRNYNKVRIEEKQAEISEIGGNQIKAMDDRIAKYGKRKSYDGARGALDRLVNEGEETPPYFFDRIDPTGTGLGAMWKELNRAEDKHIRNMDFLRQRFQSICGEYFNEKKPGSEMESWRDSSQEQTFNLKFGPVTLNPAQIMSLYCLSKRTQALGHILGNGIVASPVSIGSKLQKHFKPKEEQVSSVRISYEELQQIIQTLTPEQVKIADEMQSLLNNEMAAWGNETSLEMHGIKLFREKDYFPIKSSNEVLNKSADSFDVQEKIKNFGFTKPLTRNADNAIMIDDIFSVVADHCNKMSLYNAFAIPISDFMRVYNYKQTNEDGSVRTVQQAIGDAFTRKANSYIMKFVSDLNGNTKTKSDAVDSLINKSLANYKKASIGANVRVALQQPTAIIRAWMVIDPKYFNALPSVTPAVMKEMFEHCPKALWKSWGHYDVDMGRDIEDIMMNNDWSRWDMVTMGAYGWLDNVAWATIWQAVKNEVKATRPGLQEGSEEFWEACNERAKEVYDKTQVVDSIFNRSDVMRSKHTLTKMMTSFMAEPTLTYNVMRDSLVRAAENFKTGNKAEAAKILMKMSVVLAANAAAVSASAAIWDAIRGKGADDDDDDATFASLWLDNFLKNLLDNVNPINQIYFIKDIWSLKDGWGTSNMALEGWETLFKGISQMKKKLTEGSSKSWYEIMMNFFGGIGYITGVPIKTIMRDVKAITEKLGFEVFADDGSEEDSMSIAESLVERFGIRKSEDKETSANDEESDEVSDEVDPVDAYIEQQENLEKLKKKAADIKKSYSGRERNEKLWDALMDGYTTALKEGDVFYIKQLEQVYKENGGDMSYYETKMTEGMKRTYKQTLNTDSTWDQIYAQSYMHDYMVDHGVTETEISDMCYHSYMAKDLKAAMRLGNQLYIMDELVPLVTAGLSEEDFEKAWKYRNRYQNYTGKYSDPNYKRPDSGASTGKYIWPVDGPITSYFGPREAPTAGASTNHPAIDIGAAAGSPVCAADGGTVISAGWNGGYGNQVAIQHDNGVITYYSHLSDWNVNVGDRVNQGAQIAQVGSTGNSTGPHLDFKVEINGEPVDPLTYLS